MGTFTRSLVRGATAASSSATAASLSATASSASAVWCRLSSSSGVWCRLSSSSASEASSYVPAAIFASTFSSATDAPAAIGVPMISPDGLAFRTPPACSEPPAHCWKSESRSFPSSSSSNSFLPSPSSPSSPLWSPLMVSPSWSPQSEIRQTPQSPRLGSPSWSPQLRISGSLLLKCTAGPLGAPVARHSHDGLPGIWNAASLGLAAAGTQFKGELWEIGMQVVRTEEAQRSQHVKSFSSSASLRRGERASGAGDELGDEERFIHAEVVMREVPKETGGKPKKEEAGRKEECEGTGGVRKEEGVEPVKKEEGKGEGRKVGVGVIHLCRPKAKNALNHAMMVQFSREMALLQAAPHVGAVVVTGQGKVFAAGADISEMRDQTVSSAQRNQMLSGWEASFSSALSRKPVIAAVNGYALGGGCELAMMCDIILAGEGAVFGQPEVCLGVIPGMGGTQRLIRAVGKSRAMEMILTGGSFLSASEAVQLGLASRLVPGGAEEVLDAAISLAAKIGSLSAPVVALAKECVNSAYETVLSEGVHRERTTFYSTFAFEDQKEGMAAFVEKRAPEFKNK